MLDVREYLIKNNKGDVFSKGLDLFFLKVITGLVWLLERREQQKLGQHNLQMIKELLVFFKGLKEMVDAQRPRSVEHVSYTGPR